MQMVEIGGDMIEIQRLPESYYDDQEWAIANYERLMKEHPNQWVAVVSKEVVSAGEDLDDVETRAREKSGGEHVAVLFIETPLRSIVI